MSGRDTYHPAPYKCLEELIELFKKIHCKQKRKLERLNFVGFGLQEQGFL